MKNYVDVDEYDVDDITVPEGRRSVDPQRVSAIASSIKEIGLQTPITVKVEPDPEMEVKYILVAGAHRLEAMKSLGEDFILAFNLPPDLDERLWEIDENLCRSELSPSERAELTARRKAIYEEIHPETRSTSQGGEGRARETRRKHCDDIAERFTANTAKATGSSERKVQLDAERGAKVTPEAIAVVRGTRKDTGATLDKLKTLPAEEQVQAAEAIVAEAPEPREARHTESAEECASWLMDVLTEDQTRTLVAYLELVPFKTLVKTIRGRNSARKKADDARSNFRVVS